MSGPSVTVVATLIRPPSSVPLNISPSGSVNRMVVGSTKAKVPDSVSVSAVTVPPTVTVKETIKLKVPVSVSVFREAVVGEGVRQGCSTASRRVA